MSRGVQGEHNLIVLAVDLKGSREAGQQLPHQVLVELEDRLERLIDQSYLKIDAQGKNFTGDGKFLLFHPDRAREAVIYSLKLIEIWKRECRKIPEITAHYPLHVGLDFGLVTIVEAKFYGHCVSVAMDLSKCGEDVVVISPALENAIDLNLFAHEETDVPLRIPSTRVCVITMLKHEVLQQQARQKEMERLDDPSFYLSLVLEANLSDSLERAFEYCTKAISVDPDYAPARFQRGNLLVQMRKFDEAEKEYRETIKLDPNHVAAHNNLADLLRRFNRLDEAETEYRETIRIDPNMTDAHNKLAVLLIRQNRFAEAEREAGEALRVNPDDPLAHNNLGIVLENINWEDASEAEFRQAIRIDPSYADAHYNLGRLLLRLDRKYEAADEFGQVTILDPKHADAHYQLALLTFRQGETAEGINLLKRAFQLSPEIRRFSRRDPELDSFRNLPAVRRLLEE